VLQEFAICSKRLGRKLLLSFLLMKLMLLGKSATVKWEEAMMKEIIHSINYLLKWMVLLPIPQ
jgi:hypothetical protein